MVLKATAYGALCLTALSLCVWAGGCGSNTPRSPSDNPPGYFRKGGFKSNDDLIAVVCNFTPVPRINYRIGVPRGGLWRELLNSDAVEHGGSGHGNLGGVEASPEGCHGRPCSLSLTLPPLGALFLKSEV